MDHVPEWWDWDLELTPHVEKRMEQRSFNEIKLRELLITSSGHRQGKVDNRFIIFSSYGRER